MSMRWWRLLTVPVAVALVVVGGCVSGEPGTVPTGVPGLTPLGWNWIGRSRLLLVDTSLPSTTQVLAIDLGARRMIGRHRVDGVVQGYARLPGGLALLVAPAESIGPASLVVSDADARLRTVRLTEIDA